MKITADLVTTLLKTVDAGLVKGIGDPTPGKMCVEAAVCYALGLPHDDQPPCVMPEVTKAKITLNDRLWPSNKARAKGLRRVAVAQLGSVKRSPKDFLKALANRLMTNMLVPLCKQRGASTDDLVRLTKFDHAILAEYFTSPYLVREFLRASKSDGKKACPSSMIDEVLCEHKVYTYSGTTAKSREHKILLKAADCVLDALKDIKSPGVRWLHLCRLRTK